MQLFSLQDIGSNIWEIAKIVVIYENYMTRLSSIQIASPGIA